MLRKAHWKISSELFYVYVIPLSLQDNGRILADRIQLVHEYSARIQHKPF
jgi:hypothetical protein